MFPGTYQNDNQSQLENGFGLLEKSINLLQNNQPHFQNTLYQRDFEEIFLTNIPPHCSNVSVCTQEDRNFESFSIAGEYLGESVDHFFHDHYSEDCQPQDLVQPQPLAPPKEENSLQVQNQPQQVPLVEAEECEREDQPQSAHDETKNIPKNYIKAIFSFILDNLQYMDRLITHLCPWGGELGRLLEFVREQKRIKKYTIQRLKQLWTNPANGKALRIISCEFLRRRAPGYIFGSKIEKKMPHIKHRYRFIRAIENPSEFNSIK